MEFPQRVLQLMPLINRRIVCRRMEFTSCGLLPQLLSPAVLLLALLALLGPAHLVGTSPTGQQRSDGQQQQANSCSSATATLRIDCHPEPNANELECLRRKCCWSPLASNQNDDRAKVLERPLVGQPSCFFPPDYSCYHIKPVKTATGAREQDENDSNDNNGSDEDEAVPSSGAGGSSSGEIYGEHGAEVSGKGKQLDDDHDDPYKGKDDKRDGMKAMSVKWMLIRRDDCPASGFPDDAKRIKIELTVHDETLLNIKISEPDRVRFEPKLPEIRLLDAAGKGERAHVFFDNVYDKERTDGAQILNIHGRKQKIAIELATKPTRATQQQQVLETFSTSVESAEAVGSACCVLKVIHQISGAILFELDLGKLIYSRQFIQLPTYLSSSYVYGLGQHMGESLLKSSGEHYARSYTMFNYGHPPTLDGRSAYSSYPFYVNLAQLYRGNGSSSSNPEPSVWERSESARKLMAVGALMLNSNAMDVLVHSSQSSSSSSSSSSESSTRPTTDNIALQERGNGDRQAVEGAGLTWRLVGGYVNLYLFLGPQPHDVIGQFQTLVGRPMLPPAWTLGYHQSRLNYKELMPIKHAWGRTRTSGIPMESVWTDLDFMWRTTSYSLNNPELNDLVKSFQSKFGMHYVPVVDPAISVKEKSLDLYKPLKLAKSLDILAKIPISTNSSSNNHDKHDLTLAIVTQWTESKRAGLIDFTHPKIVDYLKEILADYKKKLNFDGLWLDMNEPELFENHASDHEAQACSLDEPLKYLPGGRNLNDRTLCMSAQFHAGKHFDIHQLYAFYQSKAHFEALKLLEPERRPFLLSRAQFVGQGKYSGTWLGDMGSSFEYLRWSLLGIIESNWFGQPLVGADICGFFGSTSDELCARWFSLGAFYPFARNHNDASARDQDPGALSEVVQKAARVSLMRRYSMLPYLYTLFYENHLEDGSPVIRSILFEFFNYFFETQNVDNLPQIDDEFMWGSAILIAPVVHPGTDSRSVFLPPGRWYDVSIGLPGSNTDDGPYDALESNWPILDAAGERVDERAQDRLDRLRKPVVCDDESGCWLDSQYTPLGSINIYQRGGQIIPTFRHFDHTQTVGQLWTKASFFLEVALDSDNRAAGSLYMDNGESEPGANLSVAQFRVWDSRLSISVIELPSEKLRFDGFVVYGVGLLEKIPESNVYHDSELKYRYDRSTQTLSCIFVAPSSDQQEILPIEVIRFETLLFDWSDNDENGIE